MQGHQQWHADDHKAQKADATTVNRRPLPMPTDAHLGCGVLELHVGNGHTLPVLIDARLQLVQPHSLLL
jgi:hypothetical protein